jgi:hypothetical protein
VGLDVAGLGRMEGGRRDRQAGNGHRVASARIPPLLGVEEPTSDGSADRLSGGSHADPHDVGGQSALGCASHSRGVAQAWLHDRSIAKYMVRRQVPPSQTWRTFLANHVQQLVAADFFVVPTATCRLLFVRVLLAHDRRRVVHIAVTERPTAAWTVQQFRDAFPWDQLPRYVLRDRDHAFDHLNTIGTQEVLTALSVAEHLRRTFHWIGPARVPRSRDRADGGRPSSRPKRVHRLLRTNTNASEPEQGCTPSPSCHAADGWPRNGHSVGRRLAPPLRATRRVVSPLPRRLRE